MTHVNWLDYITPGNPTHFAIAFLGGLIPALFWLWFWLREDKQKPEPLFLLLITFIAGMAVVPAAIPLQFFACQLYQDGVCVPTSQNLMMVWVIIEEVLKYAAAVMVVLWNKAVDEPIDYIIYLITIALGFAALENALFLFNFLEIYTPAEAAVSSKFRIVGATLLHVLASGTIGVCLAFAYYKSESAKLIAGTVGLCIAIVLHALFNFFIMDTSESGETILGVLMFVWMGVIVLFLLFEKVKLLERTHNNQPLHK